MARCACRAARHTHNPGGVGIGGIGRAAPELWRDVHAGAVTARRIAERATGELPGMFEFQKAHSNARQRVGRALASPESRPHRSLLRLSLTM
jgi:hypothetical protein